MTEEKKQYMKKYREANRDRLLEFGRSRHRNDHGNALFYSNEQRIKRLYKQPEWTKRFYNEMRDIYRDVDSVQWLSEEKLTIDHIIPLKNKNVSGLHVPWNIQVIPSKKNRFDGTYENKSWRHL